MDRADTRGYHECTADELRAVWGPFVGEAVRTKFRGQCDHHAPYRREKPGGDEVGAFTTWSYKRDGNTMWVTARANQNGPVDAVTVKAIRIE